MTRLVLAASALLMAVCVAASGPSSADQTTGPARPPLLIASMYGADLYRHYCAPCHGREGRGDGPAVAALKTAPPDLQTLARRRGGTFPTDEVVGLLQARGSTPLSPAHGSREMPMWGPIFRALDASDTQADVRIMNLVDYLASRQVK
jgi:hypothetical protein